ncbi:ATP-binding cassette domain-containing protein, partial [Nocardiopsis protaetiae]
FPGAAEPALRGVSFAVPAGTALAVVGASGAGKTTLGRLLLRDMDPDSGRILLQGSDLADLSLTGLRRATARVAQDVVLLSGTVRENIALAAGPPGPENDARVAAAVRRARVDDVAGQLDAGLDSAVGEGGRLLSGGQRQRVALARALAADARLLLLDEATSALDAENEALITEFLRTGRGERTMVVIAHRLSTVAHADLVLVLDRGRVAEFGPPGELARRGGHWARLVEAQRAGTAGVR